MSLIFIHGRAQEDYSEDELKSEFLDALCAGARAADYSCDRATISGSLVLPYYGKTLASFVKGNKYWSAKPAEDSTRSQSQPASAFITDFMLEPYRVTDAAGQHRPSPNRLPEDGIRSVGIQELDDYERDIYNHCGVLFAARILDVRATRFSERTIDWLLKDVGVYLTDEEARPAVDDIVQRAITSATEPRVIVAHSLGAVVAFRVLSNCHTLRTSYLVTLGAPLGVSAVISRLGLSLPGWPSNVSEWTNAMDRRDIVSLQTPIDRNSLFRDAYQHSKTGRYDVCNIVDIENSTDNHHGISGYLGDPVVARTILEAVR